MRRDIDPNEFRDRLSRARAEAIERYQRARAEAYAGDGPDVGDQIDLAVRDETTATYGDRATREYERIEDIEAAMARLDAGTYGVCSACGEPIEIERLRAIPETTLCATDAERLSRAQAPRPADRG